MQNRIQWQTQKHTRGPIKVGRSQKPVNHHPGRLPSPASEPRMSQDRCWLQWPPGLWSSDCWCTVYTSRGPGSRCRRADHRPEPSWCPASQPASTSVRAERRFLNESAPVRYPVIRQWYPVIRQYVTAYLASATAWLTTCSLAWSAVPAQVRIRARVRSYVKQIQAHML